MSEVSKELAWVDTHCHVDAPEFKDALPEIISGAANKGVKAILLPTVQASDWDQAINLANQYGNQIPGLVYTLGIHPLYINRAQESDIDALKHQIERSLDDPRFVGIGEIGLDYFVEGLDPQRQEYFFHAQLDLAQQFHLPVILHVCRSQDAILKALRKRKVPGGIAHAFNGSHQQAEQFIELGFKLGFGGAATYDRALQIRRLLHELPLESIVTETDAPDIPPAWLKEEGGRFNEPALLPRIAQQLAGTRGVSEEVFSKAVWQNAMQALPRWSSLMTNNSNPQSAS
ncbi:MAG: DNAase [Polynucleobacter sp. 24-46-87]|uniref:TatD family hydrolase n=1 Tax=unclassified Polynucleobacter TaxID=2640945 RepID=UPI000BCC52F1|nr:MULTISPECIES: TatD family hydrolase [unclassified Polynucleobacter]OYY19065.1 MAG: DNAase [Polynucleobacter sp. 35-46-11]OZA15254.1 MAG: DNAase [Polynucleobacter sp. 24-46-87]OZA78618.1 MAG: DNAase [Polynucleobacter sp. 39-46-10]